MDPMLTRESIFANWNIDKHGIIQDEKSRFKGQPAFALYFYGLVKDDDYDDTEESEEQHPDAPVANEIYVIKVTKAHRQIWPELEHAGLVRLFDGDGFCKVEIEPIVTAD